MDLQKTVRKIILLLLPLILFLFAGCGPSLKVVRNNFYDYDALSSELIRVHDKFPDIVAVQSIGKTHEGRSIFAVKVGEGVSTHDNRSALMAIFTEHGDEHDTTDLAVGMMNHLAENYGSDERITTLLNERDVWFVSMMNPDGVEYDLSGSVKPFSWRKNRKPTGEDTYGVDLNRNWGHK